MKAQLLTLIFIGLTVAVFAQNQSALDRIEAAKIALITERLELTPEQAEKFWPIYREYSDKQREIKRDFQMLKRDFDPKSASEEESRKILEQGHKMKEKQLELDRTYSMRMQEVVSSRQLMHLRKAEDDFKEMLMQRIRQENIQQNHKQENLRERNTDQMKQRRFN
jgi:hypothetical protein